MRDDALAARDHELNRLRGGGSEQERTGIRDCYNCRSAALLMLAVPPFITTRQSLWLPLLTCVVTILTTDVRADDARNNGGEANARSHSLLPSSRPRGELSDPPAARSGIIGPHT